MLFLPSQSIEIDRLPDAILWGYIVSVIREDLTADRITRFRFEAAVKGSPVQIIEVTGVPGRTGGIEAVKIEELEPVFSKAGVSLSILSALNSSRCYKLHHLWGTDKHTACHLAYHLPALSPKRLHQVTRFLDLPERDQCPRCRNIMNPSYLPVWRFRESAYAEYESPLRRRLPS